MDGNILRYRAFVATAEMRSFTKAASALGYSQPQTSRMVADLESEWGVQLLERSRTKVALTTEGQRLLPAARAIVAAQDEFHARVSEVCGLTSGTIRIGCTKSIAAARLGRILSDFLEDYPGMDYALSLGAHEHIEQELEEGAIDCALLRLPASSAFEARKIDPDELVAVVPKGHKLANGDAATLKELARNTMIMVSDNENARVEEAFRHARIRLRRTRRIDDSACALSLVENGLGVSVMPASVVEHASFDIVALPLDQPVFREVAFLVKKRSAVPISVQRFVHYLDEHGDREDDAEGANAETAQLAEQPSS